MKTERVEAEAGFPIVRVYGRVAFRNGSVAEVGSRVEGRVDAVHVGIGDLVRRGDPLVTLSSPDAVSARALARMSTTTLDAARAELDRVRRMAAEGAASARELTLAQRDALESEVEAMRARTNATLLGGGSGSSIVLRAPMDGVVLDVDALVGRLVTDASDVLVEVGDPSAVVVDANVYESDMGRVEHGTRAKLVASDGTEAVGTVIALGSTVDASSRTARVRIALDAPTPSFRPGRLVRVELLAPTPTVVVPSSAVLVRNGREFAVYVRDPRQPGRFERHTVATGPSVDGRVAIERGLEPGSDVVVEGVLLLDGSADLLL